MFTFQSVLFFARSGPQLLTFEFAWRHYAHIYGGLHLMGKFMAQYSAGIAVPWYKMVSFGYPHTRKFYGVRQQPAKAISLFLDYVYT